MKRNLIIYRIKSKIYPFAGEFYVFFDSRNNAGKFPAALKKTPGLIVYRYYLDKAPAFTNKLTAYCILQHSRQNQTENPDFYQLAYTALRGISSKGTIQLTLFSQCKAEAIQEAIAFREAVARTGEWKLAFLKLVEKKNQSHHEKANRQHHLL